MRLVPLLAVALLATTAHAKQWVVDAAHSSLSFSGAQAGTPFTGTFKTFTPVIDFDPKVPEKGSIRVTIAIASATIADDKEQNDSLPTEDWFFTKKFPTAMFESTSIRATGANAFEAKGKLTIRNVTQDITLPFTLSPQGDATLATGETKLDRKAFGLGGKQWADDKWIAYPVNITYRILAH